MAHFQQQASSRFGVLDGWRAMSILLVLAAHLLPLGPKSLALNVSAGVMGMAIFFTLSGFLITYFLLNHQSVVEFLIRRACRILPLAWLCLAITLPFVARSNGDYPAHFLFYANLPPYWLTPTTGHFWSLCVEIHFYLFVASLFALFGKQGLRCLPVVCVAVTAYRIYVGSELSIVTWLRVDEILAGSILALIYFAKPESVWQRKLRNANFYFVFVLFLVSCHPASGFMNYLRPYLASAVVGISLLNQSSSRYACLNKPWLAYIAAVSFALYVIHPLLVHTWLGEGDTFEKYLKRPLLLAVLIMSAHVSTFYFEQYFISLGKRASLFWRARYA